MDSPADRLHFTAIYKSVANLQKKMGKRWEGIKKEKPEWRPFRTFPTP